MRTCSGGERMHLNAQVSSIAGHEMGRRREREREGACACIQYIVIDQMGGSRKRGECNDNLPRGRSSVRTACRGEYNDNLPSPYTVHGALVHGPARRAERHTARLAELPRGAVTVVFGTRRAPPAHQAHHASEQQRGGSYAPEGRPRAPPLGRGLRRDGGLQELGEMLGLLGGGGWWRRRREGGVRCGCPCALLSQAVAPRLHRAHRTAVT